MARLINLVVICDALRNLVSFVQFKKQEHPWRSVAFSTKSNTPPCVFFTSFKLHKWYQIAQIISYLLLFHQNALTLHEKQRVEQECHEEERLLAEQGQLRVDVVDLTRLAQLKADEREQKARDYLKAELRLHKAIEDLKTKELSIQDSAKKFVEVQKRLALRSHFMLLNPFHTSLKHEEIRDFLMFSGGI